MKMYSLKTKMAVCVSLLVVLLISATAFYTFSYFESVFKQTIADQEFNLISSMAKEIDNKLEIAHTALIETSKTVDPAILADAEKAQAFLDAQTGIRTMFDNHIYFFTAAGPIIAESPYVEGRRGLDFSHREYIKKTLFTGKPAIGEPYVSSQAHGHPAIMLTAPVFGSDGKIVAILGGAMDLLKDNFLGSLSRTKLGGSGYIYLYSTNRTIIIHPESERILKQDVPLGANRLFDKAIDGFEGTAETVNSRGINYLATFKRLTNTNWILAANHPTADAYHPVAMAKQYFIMATMAGILLLLFGIWYVVGFLTTPLVAFSRHVENLGQKQRNDRFSSIFPDDEIGGLSVSFNNMLIELDRQTASLEKSKELYRTVTDFASDMVFWRSPDGDLHYVSPNCERITGYGDNEFYNCSRLLDDIVYGEDRNSWLAYSRRDKCATSETLEFRITTKSGTIRWISCVSRHVFNDAGEFCGLRGSHQDITDRKTAEEQLQYLSLHDALTGFRNRTSFENELVSYARPENLPVSVMVCDVDGLKFANDTLGHHAGDRLLIRVAAVLKSLWPATSTYRIGGDEFVTIMANTDQAAVETVCHKLHELIASYHKEDELPLSLSVGYASSEADSADLAALFKEADDNMYREKLHHSQTVRSTALTALKKAMETRDFCIQGHAERVQQLVGRLGEQAGLPEKALAGLRLLAQFHDIGKVGIPDSVLFKPGGLTVKEREVIERHAEIGYRIAISTPDLASIAEFILKHHEWWDGNGYPLRLREEQIPVECRILAIADAYDAMTSDRPYRVALSRAEAIAEIERYTGSQFDPHLVRIFISGLPPE